MRTVTLAICLWLLAATTLVGEQGPLLPSQRAGIRIGTPDYALWLKGSWPSPDYRGYMGGCAAPLAANGYTTQQDQSLLSVFGPLPPGAMIQENVAPGPGEARH